MLDETFTIKVASDVWPNDKSRRYTGDRWLAETTLQFEEAYNSSYRRFSFDLSDVHFVTLNAWVSVLPLIERLLARQGVLYFGLNLHDQSTGNLIPFGEYLSRPAAANAVTDHAFNNAERVYSIARFLESIGTRRALASAGRDLEFGYTFVGETIRHLKPFLAGQGHVLLPMVRIESHETCGQFAESTQVRIWREAMQRRFPGSPILETEQLWRAFCYEVSVNIYEHAKTAGYLSARIVEPKDFGRSWTQAAYPSDVLDLFRSGDSAFIELCASDTGSGFYRSLIDAFDQASESARVRVSRPVWPPELLSYAFDEFGTSKAPDASWATSDHALCRLLHLVSMYGGAISIASDGWEIAYLTQGGPFKHTGLGYEPTRIAPSPQRRGANVRIYLPVYPMSPGYPDRRTRLPVASLPPNFERDTRHVQGHLVPILEELDEPGPVAGQLALSQFRSKCNLLVDRLRRTRPREEALILDCSNLNWNPAQLLSFLTWIQNALLDRRSLIIELAPGLARTVEDITFAREQFRKLDEESEASLRSFRSRVILDNAAVLCIDASGEEHVLGVPEQWCAQIVLGLIDAPQSLQELTARVPVERHALLRAILNHYTPIIVEQDGRYTSLWSREEIEVQKLRSITHHFDAVARRCEAWHPKGAYHLPLHGQWLEQFLETSRILSRQRHADEAAARLIYRLLKFIGSEISSIGALAAVTSPALLLATAVQRHWPTSQRPIVLDLGPHVLSGGEAPFPVYETCKDVVLVQDVFDEGMSSGELANCLTEEGIVVRCCIGLARLVDGKNIKVGPSEVSEWWTDIPGLPNTRVHALVRIKRCNRFSEFDHNSPKAQWVEPRTLRPFRYSTLRRDRASDVARKYWSRPLFSQVARDVVTAGHFAYGHRHYTVAVDVRKALDGRIGDEICQWIVDVCLNRSRDHASWESQQGRQLEGEVSAILMPLHSQIHYLWGRIELSLAQQGRRIPIWLLDSTLFLGHGPASRLPFQFTKQLTSARDRLKTGKTPAGVSPRLRLLIVDDAMLTGETAETIIGELSREVEKQSEGDPRNCPLEWVRYLAVFGLMSEGKYRHWRGVRSVGFFNSVPFAFDEYASITGLPIHDIGACPMCAHRVRLERLKDQAARRGAIDIEQWAEARAEGLKPRSLDSISGDRQSLVSRIDLNLGATAPKVENIFSTADEAILRFHELMYMSYPVTEVLPALDALIYRAQDSEHGKDVTEHARFRGAVYEWCVQNWPRLRAASARAAFFTHLGKEVAAETEIVQPLCEMLARRSSDDSVRRFVGGLLIELTSLEGREGENGASIPGKALLLDSALSVFLLGLQPTKVSNYHVITDRGREEIGRALESLLHKRVRSGITFSRNLYLRFSRSQRNPDPEWALRVVSEILFREPERSDVAHSHRLLPQLLSEIARPDHRVGSVEGKLLVSTLGNLCGAMTALEVLVTSEALQSGDIVQTVRALMDCAMSPGRETDRIRHASRLRDYIQVGSPFCIKFTELFQASLSDLCEALMRRLETIPPAERDLMSFSVVLSPDIEGWCMLTSVPRLQTRLTNWTIDEMQRRARRHLAISRKGANPPCLKAKIIISKNYRVDAPANIKFRVLSSLAEPSSTERAIKTGRNYDIETEGLQMFGADLDLHWTEPQSSETAERFTAAYSFTIPQGFNPSRT